jgi:hypothetical protein
MIIVPAGLSAKINMLNAKVRGSVPRSTCSTQRSCGPSCEGVLCEMRRRCGASECIAPLLGLVCGPHAPRRYMTIHDNT